MNNYIRKCLIIYLSLALILCGMAGVAYAITAGEADEYVTRAQYVVDMEYVQNLLDEAEVTLLGKINKYRSTDVKFVTYDTPNKYNTTTGRYGGFYTGGNFFPRHKFSNSSGILYNFGPYTSVSGTQNGYYKTYSMYRLWNGNYYLTNLMSYRTSLDSSAAASNYYAGISYAVPVENFPGWYLIMFTYSQAATHTPYICSLVKLDPNVSFDTEAEIANSVVRVRLKNELFEYASDHPNCSRLPKDKMPGSISGNYSYYRNDAYFTPFTHVYIDNRSATGSKQVIFKGWQESSTGDYILTFDGLIPTGPTNGANVQWFDSYSIPICKFIPSDNVEYIMGATAYVELNSILGSSYPARIPDPRAIGTGSASDLYYDYEFVDCENGIKYWHAQKKYGNTKYGSGSGFPTAWEMHYSLPIVY